MRVRSTPPWVGPPYPPREQPHRGDEEHLQEDERDDQRLDISDVAQREDHQSGKPAQGRDEPEHVPEAESLHRSHEGDRKAEEHEGQPDERVGTCGTDGTWLAGQEPRHHHHRRADQRSRRQRSEEGGRVQHGHRRATPAPDEVHQRLAQRQRPDRPDERSDDLRRSKVAPAVGPEESSGQHPGRKGDHRKSAVGRCRGQHRRRRDLTRRRADQLRLSHHQGACDGRRPSSSVPAGGPTPGGGGSGGCAPTRR